MSEDNDHLHETDELLFIQHAVRLMGVKNLKPSLDPGGLWIKGPITLSWGVPSTTSGPALTVFRRRLITDQGIPLKEAIRMGTSYFRRLLAQHELPNLHFREITLITAILAWPPPVS